MLKKVNNFKLPKEFRLKPNLSLLAQAIHVYEEASHTGLRKTKTRAEVNRTGKKVYKQKGTGGARHGSKRAPIYVGGGVAHGPRPVRRILSLPSKMKLVVKNMAFSHKAKNQEIVVVDGLARVVKAKEAAKFLEKMGQKSFTLIVSKHNRALRNLKNAKVALFKDINAWQILKGGFLVIDKEVFGK